MKVKAKKINNPNCDYLTEDKVYDAIQCEVFSGMFILLNTDANSVFPERLRCKFKDCRHIKGNWTIITDKAKVR